MMYRCGSTRSLILVLLLYGLRAYAQAPTNRLDGNPLSWSRGYPVISPSGEELVVNEGEPLEITCTYWREVNLIYPTSDYLNRVVASKHEIIYEQSYGTKYVRKIRREKTVFGDTGWYKCVDIADNYSANKIYVFVKSKVSPFPEIANYTRTIFEEKEGYLNLPCRTTDPSIKPIIYDEDKREFVNEQPTLKYHQRESEFSPRDGFKFLQSRAKNLTCIAELNGTNHSLPYLIKYRREGDFSEVGYPRSVYMSNYYRLPEKRNESVHPDIDKLFQTRLYDQGHVRIGNELTVGCSIETWVLETVSRIYLTIPRNTEIFKSPRVRKLGAGRKRTYIEYTVEYFNYSDIGPYYCDFEVDGQIVRKESYITGYDGKLRFEDKEAHEIVFDRPLEIKCIIEVERLKWREYLAGHRLDWLDARTMEPVKTADVLNVYDYYHNLNLRDMYMLEDYERTLKFKSLRIDLYTRNFVCALKDTNDTILDAYYYNLDAAGEERLEFVETNLRNSRTFVHNASALNAHLKCYARGPPSPSIEWFKSLELPGNGFSNVLVALSLNANKSIEHLTNDSRYYLPAEYFVEGTDKQELMATHLPPNGLVTYMCRAWNRYRSIEAYHIFATPDDAMLRFVNTSLNNSKTYVRSGESIELRLTCNAVGKPQPMIFWFKNGIYIDPRKPNPREGGIWGEEVFVNDTTGREILIKSLPSLRVANYSCRARNLMEEIEAFQVITAIKRPDNLTQIVLLAIFGVTVIISINILYFTRRERMIRKRCLEEFGLRDLEMCGPMQINPNEMIHNQVNQLLYDRKYEFNKGRLKIEEKLGSGAFGIVMKAEAYGIRPGEGKTTVAVKMVHPYADATQIRSLATELKVMIYLGKHVNILGLLGACTDKITKRELLVIVEYCPRGNLHEYLRGRRRNFAVDPGENLNCRDDEALGVRDLISWSFQVARGMEYLAQKKVIHGDLAARNTLLTEDGVVKICDFGLAKMLYQEDNYLKSGRGLLPFKWMSIEAIKDRMFSSQSDVWSYGVLLWEFFSLAEMPYCEIYPEKLLGKLLSGYRLKRPKYATESVYQTMKLCWQESPAARPTFTELVKSFDTLLQAAVDSSYADLSSPYETMDALDEQDELEGSTKF